MRNIKYLISWIVILLLAGFSEISANYLPSTQNQYDRECERSSYECDQLFERNYYKLKERFENLRHWSLVIDTSVETNEELVFLINSQDFENALSMLKELGKDFEAASYGDVSQIPQWEKKVELFLLKIHRALTLVEIELSKIREDEYEIE